VWAKPLSDGTFAVALYNSVSLLKCTLIYYVQSDDSAFML